MKKYILLSLCLMTLSSSFAQLKDFKFKFYGQIRTDFYYNSRANEETVDGLFYMYPKDELLDGNGEDLNATSNIIFPFGTGCGRPEVGNSQDIRQSGSGLPRVGNFLLHHSSAPCIL